MGAGPAETLGWMDEVGGGGRKRRDNDSNRGVASAVGILFHSIPFSSVFSPSPIFTLI